jgi:hypothetical protein
MIQVMKSLLLILRALSASIVCATVTVSAQTQQAWIVKYNNGIMSGNHQALKMVLDSRGNIYVLGDSANANTNTGYVVAKYASNGNQVWAARYDSTNFPTASATGFALDLSNNIVVTGSAVTVKFDANGSLLWTEPYSGIAIAVDQGQNVYITGVSGNFTTSKLNPTGSNLWSQTWVYQGLPNISQAIAIDSSTNVYVGGRETAQAPRGSSEVHIGILKYDVNGNQLWEVDTSYGLGDYDVQVVGFQLDPFNKLYIEANYLGTLPAPYSTYVYNSNGVGLAVAGNPTGSLGSMSRGLAVDNQRNILITGGNGYAAPMAYTCGTYKLSTNGSYIWTNLYPTTPVGNSIASSIAVDQANSAYVTGFSTNAATGNDIITIKYDSDGNQVWLQRYDGPAHGNDAGKAIAVDNSGNVYVAGYETETNGFTSMILIKYSPVVGQKQSNGNFILHAAGSPGESFEIQASTNLQTWQDLGTILADTNGLALFEDTNAPLFPNRFYYTVPQ